jgi:hypothetical protein
MDDGLLGAQVDDGSMRANVFDGDDGARGLICCRRWFNGLDHGGRLRHGEEWSFGAEQSGDSTLEGSSLID